MYRGLPLFKVTLHWLLPLLRKVKTNKRRGRKRLGPRKLRHRVQSQIRKPEMLLAMMKKRNPFRNRRRRTNPRKPKM
jgi:hypothetical protein